jgi:hypothetical protein
MDREAKATIGAPQMAYGMSMWREAALEFPQIISDDQVDELFKPVREPDLPKFQPIVVITKHDRELAADLRLLWGYPGFSRYIESIVVEKQDQASKQLPHAVLNALLALGRYHTENAECLADISVWTADPTYARNRPLR